MRIGKFAALHGVTQDTIRHYQEIGLLVPEKTNGRYVFTEADSRDLNKILQLKEMEFTLSEVKKVLVFQRLGGMGTSPYRNLMVSVLEEKVDRASARIAKYTEMKSEMLKEVEALRTVECLRRPVIGVPLSALALLVCPNCQESLPIQGGNIENHMLMNATVRCSCGYELMIENGLIIDPRAIREKQLHGRPMPTKEEYLESCSYQFVNFLYRRMNAIINSLKDHSGEIRTVLELDRCVGFFLMQYLHALPSDVTYILVDYDLGRLRALKAELECSATHTNFLFLCCDYSELPIAQESLDCIVDHGMSRAYFEESGESLVSKYVPLLQEKGFVVGFLPEEVSGEDEEPAASLRSNQLQMEIVRALQFEPDPLETVQTIPQCHIVYKAEKHGVDPTK